MKKTAILIGAIVLLVVGGFYTWDAYVCQHMYYGLDAILSCSGGQGKGLDLALNGKNWLQVFLAAIASIAPVLYLILTKKHRISHLLGAYLVGMLCYSRGYAAMRDGLMGPGFLILAFNVIILHALFFSFLILSILIGEWVAHTMKWHFAKTLHGVFLQCAIGLIAFCVANIALITLGLYHAVVLWLLVIGSILFVWYRRRALTSLIHVLDDAVHTIITQVRSQGWLQIAFYALLIFSCMYVFMGRNLAFIPYSTAWDANHAYLFIPRAWAHHNGIYRGASGATTMPYLWFGFLTFWYKFSMSFSFGNGFMGISPDSLAVNMNFWTGPLVLLAGMFLMHSFVKYLNVRSSAAHADTKVSNSSSYALVYFGWLCLLLWLTSGMGAFLVFVDNKTDLAVMFFAVLALYAGIDFLASISTQGVDKKTIHQQAIVAGIIFAAAAIAKPTGLFDIVHFAVLFFLQWEAALVGLGMYLMILGALGKSGLLLVGQFLTHGQSLRLLGVGFVVILFGVLKNRRLALWKKYLVPFSIRALTIAVVMVGYKLPYLLIQGMHNDSISVPTLLRDIIMGKANKQNGVILLAANVSLDTLQATTQISGSTIVSGDSLKQMQAVSQPTTETMTQCLSRASTTHDTLYTNLKDAIGNGASEDLGRYVGYGRKPFQHLFLAAFLPKGCISIYADARQLCQKASVISTADAPTMLQEISQISQTPRIAGWVQDLKSTDVILQQATLKSIVAYMQANAIYKDDTNIYIPYKFLQPFNVTFNWSLQNLSSYYTDIGVMWLLLLGMVCLGLIYGIMIRDKKLTIISLITLGAWAVWWVVASGIIWYSLGLIVWTILGSAAFIYHMISEKKQSDEQFIGLIILTCVGLLLALMQLILNFTRIASQGGGGAFMRYRSRVGEITKIDDLLNPTQEQKIGYSAKDVFNLQFPHYNAPLAAINARKDGEGVIIAGTYMQYFINNQRNLTSDGFLGAFQKNASDNNVCNTYLRLTDKKTKYIVIDPNIASIVMGGSNSTLLDRFLGVIDAQGGIIQHGALTMLQALVQQGYLSYFSSSNLISKYAFITPDATLSQLLQVPAGEALLVERAKMSSARYFPKVQQYAEAAIQIFAQRVATYDAIQDVADVLGKQIRADQLISLAKRYTPGISQEETLKLQADTKSLTQDEKAVLQQFLALLQAQRKNPTQFRQYITNIISQSASYGSQLFVLTVK